MASIEGTVNNIKPMESITTMNQSLRTAFISKNLVLPQQPAGHQPTPAPPSRQLSCLAKKLPWVQSKADVLEKQPVGMSHGSKHLIWIKLKTTAGGYVGSPATYSNERSKSLILTCKYITVLIIICAWTQATCRHS